MTSTQNKSRVWIWVAVAIGLIVAGVIAYFVLKKSKKSKKKASVCKTGTWKTKEGVCYVKHDDKTSSLSCSISGAYAIQTRTVSKACKDKSTTKRVPCPLPACKCKIKSHKQINPEGTCVVDVSGKPVTISCNFAGNKTYSSSYIAVQPVPKNELKCSTKDLAIQKKPCSLSTQCCTCKKSCKVDCPAAGDSWSRFCQPKHNPAFKKVQLTCNKTCKHNLQAFDSLPKALKNSCTCPSTKITGLGIKNSCSMCKKKLGSKFLQRDGICTTCIDKGSDFDPDFCTACKSKFKNNAPLSGILKNTCTTCKNRCTGKNCSKSGWSC